jgi:hypothetical protein
MRFDPNFFSEGSPMTRKIRSGFVMFVLAMTLTALWPSLLPAEDAIEKAGVAVGVTAGNMVFLPAKAISTSMGLFFGALSFVLTGGDDEVTQQMWRNSTAEPYLITPEVARRAIGRRPELSEANEQAKPDM